MHQPPIKGIRSWSCQLSARRLFIRLRNGRQRYSKIYRQQPRLRDALQVLLPRLFRIIIQRRYGDFRVLRIRMMHGLGIMPQRLLREPFRVTTL